jgi:hypothetical protein
MSILTLKGLRYCIYLSVQKPEKVLVESGIYNHSLKKVRNTKSIQCLIGFEDFHNLSHAGSGCGIPVPTRLEEIPQIVADEFLRRSSDAKVAVEKYFSHSTFHATKLIIDRGATCQDLSI